MKRLWIGILFLAVMLAGGAGIRLGMESLQQEISQQLDSASQQALEGELSQAKARAQEAQRLWEKYRDLVAAVTDHGPMEEMDTLFSQLPIFEKADSAMNYAAVCSELSMLMQAIGENQALHWWGVL